MLTAENGHQLYVPVGFAHGFLTIKPGSEIVYKCSDYYAPEAEGSIMWNDPDIGINWDLNGEPILSSKDADALLLKDIESPFIYGQNS
jgi:dTDP-4-dehydrorhamnose 3,5-epimerase